MPEIHPSHQMKIYDEPGPTFCLLCGTFEEHCVYECDPEPVEKRFWCGGFGELVDGLCNPHLGNSREPTDHDEYVTRPDSVDEPRPDVRIETTTEGE